MQKISNHTTKSINNAQNFCSRKKELRVADDICRRVILEFPVYSDTRFERVIQSKRASTQKNKLLRFASNLISEIRGYSSQNKDENISRIKSLQLVKKLKVGNCGELADATFVACKLNKQENSNIYRMMAYNTKNKTTRNLDHSIVGINFSESSLKKVKDSSREVHVNDRKGIVIDPWVGITEYSKNVNTEYSNRGYRIDLLPNEIISFEAISIPKYTKKELAFLKDLFPKLSKKPMNLISKIRLKFLKRENYDISDFPERLSDNHKKNAGLKLGIKNFKKYIESSTNDIY